MNISTEISEFEDLSSHDVHALLKLRAEVFVVEQECFYVDPDDEDRDSFHLLMKDEKRLIAYSRFYLDGSERWHIGRVVVRSEQRGKGHARHMMKTILDHIHSSQNNHPIELSAQVYLESFYRSISFEPVGNMYLDAGLPHIRMLYQDKS